MKKINLVYIISICFLIACTNSNLKGTEEIEVVSVNLNKNSDINELVDKIEMIPLETTRQSLVDGIKKIMYARKDSLFLILDKRNVISVFTETGKFCNNSEDLIGNGPQQYNSIVDVSYNQDKESIEILTINGEIKSYNNQLKFNGYKNISIGKGYRPSRFMALDSVNYIVAPTINQNENIFYVNTLNEEVHSMHYGNMIANISMGTNCFYKFNDKCYFVPTGINYYFYEIKGDKELSPIIYLDFGMEKIETKDLVGDIRYGEYNIKKPNFVNYFTEINKRDDYLVSSNYYLPIMKFFNDKYVYVHAIKKRKPYNYIYNRKTKTTLVQYNETPIPMKFCLGIDDNILYTYINPFEIEKYCNTDLITPESKERIEKVQEEDNIIIVKYHLK